MDLMEYKNEYIKLALSFGENLKVNNLNGVESFRRVIDKIKEDSGVVMVNFDPKKEEQVYTIICLGTKLNDDDGIRIDTCDLEGGLSYICVEYWNRVKLQAIV
ncbi:MAG: hypothetical protein ACRC7N_06075 [Clostridium sp.]